jgi:hypothetical protein
VSSDDTIDLWRKEDGWRPGVGALALLIVDRIEHVAERAGCVAVTFGAAAEAS